MALSLRKGDEADDEGQTSEISNPYFAAQRKWNYYLDAIESGRRTWQIIAIGLLFITIAAVGGLVYLASLSKFVPYVVEVDQYGHAVAKGPIDPSAAHDTRIIRAAVASFVESARIVTPDRALQRKMVLDTYAKIAQGDAAFSRMNEWLNGKDKSNPFERAKSEIVSVEDIAVLQQSEQTWEVDWTETTRDYEGVPRKSEAGLPPRARMKALVTIYFVDHDGVMTDDEIARNPVMLRVKDFSWTLLGEAK